MMNTHRFFLRRVAPVGLAAAFAWGVAPVGLADETVVPSAPVAAQPAVAPALSPQAIQLQAVLIQRFGDGSAEVAAYAARGFQPIWLTAEGQAADPARVLVSILERAHEHALPAQKYGGAALAARLGAADLSLEADLTAAFLSYARDVSSGLLEPRRVDRELHVYPERPDPGALVRAAGTAQDMAAYLGTLPPSDPSYTRLIERYAAFRSLPAQDLWGQPVSQGRTLRPGDNHPRVAEARARLTAMGDLDPNVYDQQAAGAQMDGTQVATNEVTTDVPVQTFDPGNFDQPMVDALQRFQDRHGLNLDGVIGPATLGQLNTSPSTRAKQIAVNLERMRWMNRDLGERHILVNIAGFTMAVMDNGREDFTSRVVVGKARRHRTPEFSDVMSYMVANPSWHVPRSIATEEILPKLRANPGYLAARGMRLVGADASAVDWASVTPGTFPGRITQRPGPNNALGTVKFMFPNDFAIYLHDTPSKRLFQRDIRAYSHGCVRVERPHEFAAYLLEGQVDDPTGWFQQVLSTRRERRIDLDRPLPVHLTYRTAWIDEGGQEQFRGDIYGRDKRVAAALEKAGVTILQ